MSETGQAPLFRAEVTQRKKERLHGNVNLALPVSWQIIGTLLIGAIIIAIAFLASASYSRVEQVSGIVSLDTGVASIVPSRAGRVFELLVAEGDTVHAGDPLVRVRAEEDLITGDTAPERMHQALNDQDERLAMQSKLLARSSAEERARVAALVSGYSGEIASLDGQIADQERLVASAQAEYTAIGEVAANGFISRRDLEAREANLISRKQQLAQLDQARTAKRAALAEAKRSAAQSDATVQAQIAGTESSRAALTQQLAEVDLARGYTLTAPVTGVVTALVARLGQPAVVDQPLLMIVPHGARTRVELYVPTSAAGFLSEGQEVRLSVDAFPYERFGTINGRITSVSKAAITRNGSNGPIPAYLVEVGVPRPWVNAFGRRQALLPGMTLAARIVTDRQSLLRWLFEPIFAVRDR